MRVLIRLVGIPLLLGAFFSVLFVSQAKAAPAPVKPGDTCTQTGAFGHDKKGQRYICRQASDEDCPHWHWVYNRNVPKGQTPASAAPCVNCPSATPSVTPSQTPSQRLNTTRVSRADVRATLPDTNGQCPWWLVWLGIATVAVGVVLCYIGYRKQVDNRSNSG